METDKNESNTEHEKQKRQRRKAIRVKQNLLFISLAVEFRDT